MQTNLNLSDPSNTIIPYSNSIEVGQGQGEVEVLTEQVAALSIESTEANTQIIVGMLVRVQEKILRILSIASAAPPSTPQEDLAQINAVLKNLHAQQKALIDELRVKEV